MFLAGCASIVHRGPREIPIASNPTGATVSIYDRDGAPVAKQTTPFTARLSPGYKYFRGQNYKLVFEMPGYEKSEIQLRPTVSGWYFANLLIGGALGMLIVDPLTGAMYNLTPDQIEQAMPPETAEQVRKGNTLYVILKSQASPAELQAMRLVTSGR
jgi:hypothetical protein